MTSDFLNYHFTQRLLYHNTLPKSLIQYQIPWTTLQYSRRLQLAGSSLISFGNCEAYTGDWQLSNITVTAVKLYSDYHMGFDSGRAFTSCRLHRKHFIFLRLFSVVFLLLFNVILVLLQQKKTTFIKLHKIWNSYL